MLNSFLFPGLTQQKSKQSNLAVADMKNILLSVIFLLPTLSLGAAVPQDVMDVSCYNKVGRISRQWLCQTDVFSVLHMG